jgi:hypothetical protein
MKNHLTLLSRGSKIGGAAVGAAAGSLAGPLGTVAGAAIGAVAGEIFVVVLDDLAQRYLSPREEQRVAGVAALAIDGIRQRLLWEQRRDDGFFEADADAPSPAEELLEGVLLNAKHEHELLKLPYLARFYTNVVFMPYVGRAEANHQLSIVESMTYAQLCILGLMAQSTRFPVRDKRWPKVGAISAESMDLAQQAFSLFQRQLLLSYHDDGDVADLVLDVTQVIPSQVGLSPTGKRVVDLFGLEDISVEELRKIAKIL